MYSFFINKYMSSVHPSIAHVDLSSQFLSYFLISDKYSPSIVDRPSAEQVRAAHTGPSARPSSSRVTKVSSELRVPTANDTTHNPVTSSIFKILQHSKNQRQYSKDGLNSDDYICNNNYNSNAFTSRGQLSPSRKVLNTSDQDSTSDTSISLSCSLPGLTSSSSSSTQRGRVSFHSSNDSGFSNDCARPAQPTVDYSDADSFRLVSVPQMTSLVNKIAIFAYIF